MANKAWQYIAITVCLIIVPAAHSAPPLELKGYEIGSPRGQLVSSGFYCNSVVRPGFEGCIAKGEMTVAGADVGTFTLQYHQDALKAISCGFAPSDFDDIVAALSTKYGAPAIKRSEVTNAMGAKFDNAIASWERKDGSIAVMKRASKVTEGFLMIHSADFMTLSAEADGTSKTARAKDL